MTRAMGTRIGCAILLCVFSSRAFGAGDVSAQLRAILEVDKEGTGHDEAVRALKELSQQSTESLVPILAAMDDANPLAENWLRGAFETVADRNRREGSLPKEELEKFALDRSHAPQSRRLAFDWLVRIDPGAVDRLIPGMIDDPSADFRRLATQQLLDAAKAADDAKDTAKCKELYTQAFNAALDPDQLDLAFDELKELGEKPDLKARLGFISDWWVIGPFDHHQGIGFEAKYPPEGEIALDKKYAGTMGEVAWMQQQSAQRHGVVDFNKFIGKLKGAAGYAYCEFESEKDQPVEFRIGTPNGWKLWVNDEMLFAHEEYHMANRMDQYRVKTNLKAGTNKLLMKICQNEQVEDWTEKWEFRIRVCDPFGAAVLPRSSEQSKSVSAAGQ